MRKLHVAIVAPSLGILGGQAVQADRLLQAWRSDSEVDAWLVPVNPTPPGVLKHAVRVKYARTIATELTYIPLLAKQLGRADVVHVFSASYSSFLLAPLPAILVARALGRPVVLNYRSGQAPDHLRRSSIARRTIRGVDRNVVPSQFLADVFADYGIESTIIPNLVDLSQFAYRERNPLAPRLLSTRNFESLYDVACTLRAFALVQQRYADAALTLVGGGSEEPMLRSLATDLGVRNVAFAGRVRPDEISGYCATHDLYVQSPTIDNMPTSVLEAFASGMPVVSTEAGGIPAILTHGEHGLLTPIGDAPALAAAVLQLLASPEHARRLARQAYATCADYAWDAVRERWLHLYRSVLPSPVCPAAESSWS